MNFVCFFSVIFPKKFVFLAYFSMVVIYLYLQTSFCFHFLLLRSKTFYLIVADCLEKSHAVNFAFCKRYELSVVTFMDLSLSIDN